MSSPLPAVRTAPLPASLSVEQRILVVAASIALHLMLLAGGAMAAAIVAVSGRPGPAMPQKPLLIVAVALVLAHCSLSALAWARTNAHLHAKTAMAALATVGMWGVLMLLLGQSRQNGLSAAAWAAAVLLQSGLSAVLGTAIEFLVEPEQAAQRTRFSVGYILIWTAIAAALLGIAVAWAASAGFRVADATRWTYFLHLQTLGAGSGLLAAALYAGARFSRSRTFKAAACLTTIGLFTAGAPLAFRVLFADNIGASIPEIAWLFGGQGLFLMACLLPVEFLSPPEITRGGRS